MIDLTMHYITKSLLILLIILVFSGHWVFAADDMPYSFSESEILEGGKLIVNQKENGYISSFFFKPNFNDDSEILYTWDGIKRKNVKGVLFQYGYILGAMPYKEALFAVWSNAGSVFAGIIDTTADVISEVQITDDISLKINKLDMKYQSDRNCFIILLGTDLFSCCIKDGNLTSSLIANNVFSYDIDSSGSGDLTFILIKEANGLIYNAVIDSGQTFVCRTPVFENVKIRSAGDRIISVTYPNNSRNSILRMIDKKRGVVSEFNLEETADLLEFNASFTNSVIYYIGRNKNSFSLFKSELIENKDLKNIYRSNLPPFFIEPMAMKMIGRDIFVLFRNGICTIDENGSLQSADIFPLGEYFTTPPEIHYINENLILSAGNTNIIFDRSYNSFWMINSFLETTGSAIIPIISILLVLVFVQLYRHQKRLLLAVLNLPTSGIVFVIDKNGRLTKANSSGKKILGITNSVPLGKPFQYYCALEHSKPINDLVQKSLSLRETLTQKITIQDNDRESKEWYCNALPIRNLAGQYRGIVFTCIDITEELERKRLSNWAQLAHDMQTNLSTIKLNTEQLEFDEDDKNFIRRNKILHQTKLMIQRVRDIVTVGRTDALGMQQVNSADICQEVRNEFDETLFPDIKFSMECKNFKVFCDRPKLIRALRNAVENAIKAIPGQKGGIIISCSNDHRFAYFNIKDTGAGMEQKVVDKMMTPYFTTAKDKSGYGMGTMIMQHVMELHAGKLEINSKQGEGTEVLFIFPNYIQKQK
jgi:two-component system, OmpR family, phosphate regulon sensor histidine kinase PhoR